MTDSTIDSQSPSIEKTNAQDDSASVISKSDNKIEKVTIAQVDTTQYKKVANSRDADATLHFQNQYDDQVPEITPEQDFKLSRKVRWFIITFTALVDLLLYMDKATLSYASIFSFWADTGLDQNKYNNANTLFYVGYIVGQVPGTYLMQKLPIGKLLFGLTFIWSVITFLTCVVHNYGGVLATRFCLGLVESVVIPILNTTMSQFFDGVEKAATAPLFFTTCMGVTIPTGFIAYGVLYIKSDVALWKFFMIIIGSLTFIMSILILFFYPDNPSNAKFLSIEERIWVIRKVQRSTGSSIEQKLFKKYQFIECIKDPISWLFALYLFLLNLANNLPYQQNLLFGEMGGISNLDSTLVSTASGGFAVICCLLASLLLYKIKDFSAFSIIIWTLPSFVGSICAAALPWDNKIGILANLTMASPVFGVPWIIMFSWSGATCSGYTKKLTRNAMTMAGYGIANIISPQLWRESDSPRYITAWIVQIVLSFTVAPLVTLAVYFILKKRNVERLANLQESEKLAVIEDDEGETKVINVASLDLTDLENKTFIYPL